MKIDRTALPIDAIFNPKSIAILGASDRPGSIGAVVLDSLRHSGYGGSVWPVNPRFSELASYRCYQELAELPSAPDLVAICTRGESALGHLETISKIGGRAAVIYDGGFAETGSDGAKRQDEIAAFCRQEGIAVCGPNCMGAINTHTGATTYKLPLLDIDRLRGNVGIISQSGSITIGLLGDTRRFGFSSIVSTGNEVVLDAADFVDAFVDDEKTRIIALFLESARNGQRFLKALERAAIANKPVVVLKVGQSARAKHAVQSHTGGLAGEARVFSEVLRKSVAIEVNDIDEMTEVLAALQARKRPRGRRIAVVTGSGGQAELMLDIADANGIELPPLDQASRQKAEDVIGRLTGDGNPMDAWGSGDVNRNLPHAFSVLEGANYDALVLCNENIDHAPIGRSEGVMKLFCDAAINSEKPFFALNMRPGLMHADNVRLLKAAGAGMLGGARQGLLAIDRVAKYTRDRLKVSVSSPAAEPFALKSTGNSKTINEFDSKRILASYGVPVIEEQLASDFPSALQAARHIGWPVVLKPVSDDLPHKSELGVVKLGIDSEEKLASAFSDIESKLGGSTPPVALRGYLVQPMVSRGVEVFAGLKRDPQWGMTLVFGVGGVLIELIRESALRLLPVCEDDIDAMLRQTKAWDLLCGVRGAPEADIDALRNCLAAVARFGMAAGDTLSELDLNPIKVLPRGEGCRVLDALIVTN
jgi:acetate---CoA ligase (ADP-forming)